MHRGFATSIDLQTLSFETKITLSKQVARLQRRLQNNLFH